MEGPRRPRLSDRQAQVIEFIRIYGRTHTASPSLRETADAMEARATQAAKEIVDRLVNRGYLERRPGARGLRVVDESEIPVILATESADQAESLVTKDRIVETVRGLLADSFDPKPDFLVVVENRSRYSRMLAVCKHADASEGDTVVGRIGDEVIVGKLKSGYVELEHGTCKTEGASRRIARGARDFRLEGIVTGEVTAKTTARKP